ncbi:ferrous iron transporter C [Photorhabdus luminescens]|uniref:Probable [Fe-S]-dependent transcriptional repressor n=1 Tax=Photorhabdus akhurstii TaxID=171438 RepID=A0ABX8LMQ4_9GAMM|nr:FeoC-like transcriptional regulator [Photorhabdus akhurstii]KGM26429.1 ferrous iron transporter C [Photorhabdus luminescens]PQQ40803.1 ferrous iron transporter C [Photorhabdus luminescens]QXF31887.1 ferrous iron transporter C [Photorhabdus akhurstii]UJD73681.1 ferrous iron transporter C [Photorhabdus luminescens]
MISLLQVRDAVALNGRADAKLLSHQLSASLSMVEAMLEQLTVMGKLEKIDATACLSGSCKQCPETQKCDTAVYRIAGEC